MGDLQTFLESSSISGLNFISTTKRYAKLFWIIVVVLGFTGAGVMIFQSFQDWGNNPISTTIETRPIAEIKFPKVTVCPPKDTYTDLNYDLMLLENKTLDNNTRHNLTNYATELLQDNVYASVMNN